MVAKKTASKKKKTTSTKKTRTKRTKAGGGGMKRAPGKRTVVSFMLALIRAGYMGKELPGESGTKGKDNYVPKSKAQNKVAQELRQMAEKLERQASRFGDADVGVGGGEDE